jgi:branched-chain amino acid transport system substrate-binding protein
MAMFFVRRRVPPAVAVVGEVCSAATVAAAGVSSSSKIPLISPAATSPALSGEDLFFRTVPSDRFQGQAAANLLIRKGYRNVAMVYEDAAYGYGLAFNFMASFTKGRLVGPHIQWQIPLSPE